MDRLRYKSVAMNVLLNTPAIHQVARSLTLGSYSGMNKALDYYDVLIKQGNKVDARGIFAYRQDIYQSLGWVLFTREYDCTEYAPQYHSDRSVCLQVYVKPEHRRLGIGSKLIRRAEKLAKDNDIYVYTYENPFFFDQFVKQHNFRSV